MMEAHDETHDEFEPHPNGFRKEEGMKEEQLKRRQFIMKRRRRRKKRGEGKSNKAFGEIKYNLSSLTIQAPLI